MQLKIQDVAQLLGVSKKTIYRLVKSGVIPTSRVNEQYRVDRTELLEYVTANKIPVSAEIYTEPNAAESAVNLAHAIESGGVYYDIEGTDPPSVLRCVVDTMHVPEGVDRDVLYEVLLAREKACSTAIGDGMAIPHARNPIVLHVQNPSVTVCFLERPVEFGAMDGKPVRVLFTLVSPTVPSHLQLLSRLAYALQTAKFKEAIVEKASLETILREAHRLDSMLDDRTQS